jgi:hypothetical protein
MQTTIKQLIREVSDIALNHKQIKSFDYGEPLTLIKKRTVKYAALWMNISVSSFDEKKTTFNIEFFCMDRVNKDDRNKVDVENTTSRILRDIYNIIRFSTRWQDFGELVQSVQNQKYYDYTADRVTGWGQTISFNVWNTDCFADLPMGDYDFNQTIPIDVCDVLAIVKNTDNDILATKLVSDSDDTIIVPNITITDSDGTEIDYPSGVNFTCTAGGGSGDVEVNGVVYGQYTAPTTFDVDVINNGSNPVGSLQSGIWLVDNTEVFINSTQVGDVVAEDTLNINVTLDGVNSGSWNGALQTWQVASSPCDDATVTVNGEEFATVPSGDTLPIQVLDENGDEYLGVGLSSPPNIFIPPVTVRVNNDTDFQFNQGLNTLNVRDQNFNFIGSFQGFPEPESYWKIINPIRGNFQANRGVLDTFVVDASSAGVYTGTTNDGGSGTVTILVNGVAIAFPQTLAIGDLIDVSRSTTTSIGWYQLNG